ncbi:MAG: NmrA family NAD(P)-binding protein [Deltaproteobacteria bacterium]|nr:NmrA family NAD(P)-binding protein [Deltaproteobacteria bacterium]
MFTIFGATGNTGSVVASELLAQGKKVRIVVRSKEKGAALAARGAEIALGDVLDAASVAAALKGAEGAYLLVPPDPTSTDLRARGRAIVANYAAALRASPIAHAAVLSSVAAHEPAGTGPIVVVHHAEEVLGALGATRFTFVRAAYFMENLLGFAHPMKVDGTLPVFGGGESFRFPMVATRDIGRTAAAALLAPPSANEVIELSGPEEYSMNDAAAVASKVLGREVIARALPIEGLVPTYTSLGISADVAGLYREMTEGLAKGLVKFEGKGRAVRGEVTLAEVLSALKG